MLKMEKHKAPGTRSSQVGLVELVIQSRLESPNCFVVMIELENHGYCRMIP
jgi:hypothetical protein